MPLRPSPRSCASSSRTSATPRPVRRRREARPVGRRVRRDVLEGAALGRRRDGEHPKGTVITERDAHGQAPGFRREAQVHRSARRPGRTPRTSRSTTSSRGTSYSDVDHALVRRGAGDRPRTPPPHGRCWRARSMSSASTTNCAACGPTRASTPRSSPSTRIWRAPTTRRGSPRLGSLRSRISAAILTSTSSSIPIPALRPRRTHGPSTCWSGPSLALVDPALRALDTATLLPGGAACAGHDGCRRVGGNGRRGCGRQSPTRSPARFATSAGRGAKAVTTHSCA